MKRCRYRGRVLSVEYLRAGIGLAITAGPLLSLDPAPIVSGFLGTLAALFAAFAMRTGLRNFTVVELTEEGIAARGPVSRRIPWCEVRLLRLDFFCTSRERERGWMQLKITGRARPIRIESTIDGFNEIVATVADIAKKNSVPLSDTTVANFRALGISVDGGKRGWQREG